MPLTDKQLRLIEEGIRLAVTAVLAAVRTADDDGPLDWSSLRITETPEIALERARNQKSGVRRSEAKETKEAKEAEDNLTSSASRT